jgi:hypothetical protein
MLNRSRLVFLLLAALLVGIGCERSPEDVERWRNAKDGMKKMQEWATSPDEPMKVRKAAFRVLIEERAITQLTPTLEEVSAEDQKELVAVGAQAVSEQWKAQDMPTIDGQEKKGGRVKVSASKSVAAKDAAYYLIPFAEGKTKEQLTGILTDWFAKDWELRDQLGKTNLKQLFPRAGDGAIDHALKWLEQTNEPAKVVALIKEHGDSKAEEKAGDILAKRAKKAHPDVSPGLLTAISEVDSEAGIDYLKMAIRDPKTKPVIVDQCMEALKKLRGERATTFFSKLIREEKGKLRWAAVDDMIVIRGKAGLLSAATSMPIEKTSYAYPDEDSFKKDANYFGSRIVDEMNSRDVSTISNTVTRALESERWPVQVLGLAVAKQAHSKGDLIKDGHDKVLKAVKALTSSRESIPGWGEEMRVGELAHEVADFLEK